MVRAGGYLRQDGVESFSISIDSRKLPTDHPYQEGGPLIWSIILENLLTKIQWENMEIGSIRDALDEEHGRVRTFEAFGLTNKGSACRIAYELPRLNLLPEGLEGTLSATNSIITNQDIASLREALTNPEQFYLFLIGGPCNYP